MKTLTVVVTLLLGSPVAFADGGGQIPLPPGPAIAISSATTNIVSGLVMAGIQ